MPTTCQNSNLETNLSIRAIIDDVLQIRGGGTKVNKEKTYKTLSPHTACTLAL